ncbi:MAG: rhamnulokinase [Propionibacteriaceae bacterium]|nr:rhamnulokinase [Propionibacteriaceae bacterium]
MRDVSAARLAAVDLGASSGRVAVAEVGPDRLALTEVYRFPNAPARREGRLVWDFDQLWGHVVAGLRAATATGPIDGVGLDTWGVDYGLLDARGRLLGDPACYRCDRTEDMPERVWGRLSAAGWGDEAAVRRRLYEVTGIQQQRFNTIYQVAEDDAAGRLVTAAQLLLLPCLIAERLTGVAVAEVTHASTTGLFDATRRAWADDVIAGLGLPRRLFGRVVEPGTVLGPVTPAVQVATGLGPATQVVAGATHDTAAAVVATPLGPEAAFIASGTWSLAGLELPAPVLSEASQAANFTNELGVDGTVRYLKNLTGLWLLSECQRAWGDAGLSLTLAELLAGAEWCARDVALVDADADEFLAPGDMPARLAHAVTRTGGKPPETPFETVRCVLDSLAAASARTIAGAEQLTGRTVERIQLVGGGSLNRGLCQATADATGRPVHAGPVEASLLGNALIQARALGALRGGLADLRDLVTRQYPSQVFLPHASA